MPEESAIEHGESHAHPPSRESNIPVLSFNEARALGCLLEKETTTPDYYPLTSNSLHAACNQSSNRFPVTTLGLDEVEEAVEGLRYKNLAKLVHQAGARVAKCKHTIEAEFPYMTRPQMALLCVLLLRGQQTAGELRQRTERLHNFADIESLEAQLVELIHNKPAPLVKKIPGGGGRRAETYVHLLCGDVEPPDSWVQSPAVSVAIPSKAAPGRIEELENELAGLKSSMEELRAEIQEIKQQLGI